jgi:UDP-glucuronate decarboxylase
LPHDQTQPALFQLYLKGLIMARILVTGGAGFLGSHLCERLVERGEEVICLDNLFTGRKSNIYHLMNHDRFEFVRHDIVEPILVEVDQIYNLACPASPVAYQYNPIKTIKTSTLGTVNVLGLAKRCRARILHASTSEVYGDPDVHPQPESYWGNVNPLGPRSCYDEGKRVSESLCMNYHLAHGVEIRIIRIFNTYGPRMDPNDGRVISNFITQALRNEPLTVYGDGSQTRSFCYRDDLIEGMIRLMDQDEESGPVNIGNPGEYSMLELAEEVIKATNSASIVELLPLPQDDPKQRCPDITKARQLLDWEPTVKLQAGLKQTVAYYREELGIQSLDEIAELVGAH